MSLKKPVWSVSLSDYYLIRVCAIYACSSIQLKMRFSMILNNFCNFACPLHPFKYDILYISAILPANFLRILWWRCGEIMFDVDF